MLRRARNILPTNDGLERHRPRGESFRSHDLPVPDKVRHRRYLLLSLFHDSLRDRTVSIIREECDNPLQCEHAEIFELLFACLSGHPLRGSVFVWCAQEWERGE